jgi:integration host factor subunit beta
MKRTTLVDQVGKRRPDIDAADMRLGLDAQLDRSSDTPAAGGRVELRGFGTFQLAPVPARRGLSPMTGAVVME